MASQWIAVVPGIDTGSIPIASTARGSIATSRCASRSDGCQVEEARGWASEGWTVKLAQEGLSRLRKAKRTGEGPTTLRKEAEANRRVEQRRAEEELRWRAGRRPSQTYGTGTARKWWRSRTSRARPPRRPACGNGASNPRSAT
jgi:hypothetical protein